MKKGEIKLYTWLGTESEKIIQLTRAGKSPAKIAIQMPSLGFPTRSVPTYYKILEHLRDWGMMEGRRVLTKELDRQVKITLAPVPGPRS